MRRSKEPLDYGKVLRAMAPGVARIKTEIPAYPKDCCADTCWEVLEELNKELPETLWNLVRGWFVVNPRTGDTQGHSWLVERRTGSIVDPTAGQFLPGTAIRIFTPSDKEFARYLGTHRAYARHATAHQ